MPLNNPTHINVGAYWDPEGTAVCVECATRLSAPDPIEEYHTPITATEFENWGNRGETLHCQECRAFAQRRHPAMFSTVRTQQEIQAEIERCRDNRYAKEATREDMMRFQAKIEALEWVLGEDKPSPRAHNETGHM